MCVCTTGVYRYTPMFSYLNGKNDDQFMGQFIWAPHVQSQFIQWWGFFLLENPPFTSIIVPLKKNMDHKVTRHSQPAIHRGFHRPHSSGALLPATGAEQGIEPRPLWHNSNQFPDSRHHWGAQRKFPAVALTLVILGGYGWIMSWTEKPHDPTGLPCCANEEQVS